MALMLWLKSPSKSFKLHFYSTFRIVMNDRCIPIQTLYKRSNIYTVFMHDVNIQMWLFFASGEVSVLILFLFIFFWGGGVGG